MRANRKFSNRVVTDPREHSKRSPKQSSRRSNGFTEEPTENIKRIQWLTDNENVFSMIKTKRDIDFDTNTNALAVVKKFIKDRGLILYGGLAIDYALRKKGKSLYPDDQLPDFDMLSPNHSEDAYDLAEILSKEGFINVSAIRAKHPQTMRVRTNFIFVADISYVHKDVFSAIPWRVHDGIKFVAPHFQIIDMHLSLSFPFRGNPFNNIDHRWKKDVARYNKLVFEYDIGVQGSFEKLVYHDKDSASGDKSESKQWDKSIYLSPKKVKINAARLVLKNTHALHGYAAFALLSTKMNEYFPRIFQEKFSFGINDSEIEFEYPGGLQTGDNKDEPFRDEPVRDEPVMFFSPSSICTTNISAVEEDFAGSHSKVFISNPYMDFVSERHRFKINGEDLDVFNVNTDLLSISKVNHDGYKVTITCVHHLLQFFAVNWVIFKRKEAYDIYCELIRMIRVSFSAMMSEGIDSSTKKKLVALNPFGPSVNVIGSRNYDIAAIIQLGSIYSRVKDIPEGMDVDPKQAEAYSIDLPANYNVDEALKRPNKFRYTGNIFNYDGKIRMRYDG